MTVCLMRVSSNLQENFASYRSSEKYLGFCFSDKTAPAIESYVPVIYGLQNKIQDTLLKYYGAS